MRSTIRVVQLLPATAAVRGAATQVAAAAHMATAGCSRCGSTDLDVSTGQTVCKVCGNEITEHEVVDGNLFDDAGPPGRRLGQVRQAGGGGHCAREGRGMG